MPSIQCIPQLNACVRRPTQRLVPIGCSRPPGHGPCVLNFALFWTCPAPSPQRVLSLSLATVATGRIGGYRAGMIVLKLSSVSSLFLHGVLLSLPASHQVVLVSCSCCGACSSNIFRVCFAEEAMATSPFPAGMSSPDLRAMS